MMWPGARRGRDSERLFSRVRFAALLLAAPLFTYCYAGCYTADNGKEPPSRSLYYPTGLTVSPGGNVLFVANSDFDLQFKGGTLQSYDLFHVRKAVLDQLKNPPPGCPDTPRVSDPDSGARIPPGQTCSPPVDSSQFQRDTVLIGAFTADLVRSAAAYPSLDGENAYRLFLPVRGDATLTWADVTPDTSAKEPPEWKPDAGPTEIDPIFRIRCGAPLDGDRRCDDIHHAGRADDPGNPGPKETTDAGEVPETLPGEPFGIAQSADGQYILVTHQSEAKATLFDTGLRFRESDAGADAAGADAAVDAGADPYFDRPSLKYILDQGLAVGGTGVAYVPEDPRAYPPSTRPLAPAFYATNRTAPQVTLFRVFPDANKSVNDTSRPALLRESVAGIAINANGVDSRDIVLDPTPRIQCEKQLRFDNSKQATPKTDADLAPQLASCARRPARVYISNRSPASLLVGELGDGALGPDGSYNGTRITFQATIPLAAGPSRLYVAPIIDNAGLYALRIFVVCFDSRTVFVINPDRNALENIIRTADGPFALTFDPFDLEDVIDKRLRGVTVPFDARFDAGEMRLYRFAYLASFTRSFVQVIDLDNSRTDKSTFETVVYSMGLPTKPVGSK